MLRFVSTFTSAPLASSGARPAAAAPSCRKSRRETARSWGGGGFIAASIGAAAERVKPAPRRPTPAQLHRKGAFGATPHYRLDGGNPPKDVCLKMPARRRLRIVAYRRTAVVSSKPA